MSAYPRRFIFTLSLLAVAATLHAALPTDEAGAIAYLSGKGVTIKNAAGHAVKLSSKGEPVMTAEEYQLIGKLTQLEEADFNATPLSDGEWGFLKALPKLKKLTIGHSKKFASLEHFAGLPVESLTIGGCMGLRDLNRTDAAKLRNAITTLHDLPNLKKVSLYHSPLAPDDAHLAYFASHFPKLEDLRLDFAAPVGSQTSITPAGLTALHKLPLTVLNIESVESFTPAHFKAIAGITTLKTLTVDGRKSPVPADGVAAFKQARPDVEVVVSAPGDKGPPQAKKK